MPALNLRFKAVTLACTDLDRSRRFYEEILGARYLPTDGLGCPWYRLGGLTLTLMPNAAEPSPARFPDHAMPLLWLEVDDLEAAEAHFRRHDVPILDQDQGQFMLIADPDGLLLEIWQKQDDESGESLADDKA